MVAIRRGCGARSKRGFATGFATRRREANHSRSNTAAPRAAAFRSVRGRGDLCDRARLPAPSIARARQKLCPQKNAPRVPASRHAPPALTFGLPGKQSVNRRQAGCILIRFVRHLPHINEILRPEPAPPQGDLVLQEINEFDPGRLQRLRIERRLGQPRERIGFQIDRSGL